MAMVRKNKGAVAAGHPTTAAAAASILADGGNAFDAALAALATACVVEPALASLGGGGFLLAHRPDSEPLLIDFFAQTPKRRHKAGDVAFEPILADFGTATQEFHVGLGAAAAPGVIPGLFHIHGRLGRLPLTRIVEPAIAAARDGVTVNPLQAYLFDILRPIFSYSVGARAAFADGPGEGAALRNADLADTLEALAQEGEALYRAGELGRAVADLSRDQGGHLTMADIADYRVVERRPLTLDYHGHRLLTNPPPSAGGILIAFALRLLERRPPPDDAAGRLDHLARAMHQTNKARVDSAMAADRLLDPAFLKAYAASVADRPHTARGTTHISVIDGAGDAAALTVSNGEGCGHVVPGTGIMLNNMLGEEDLHPDGFDAWPENSRISSMMAPSVLLDADGRATALGSGGSNRLRTAILQVLLNMIDLGMAPEPAVTAPRIHYERGLLNVEGGFDDTTVEALTAAYPNHQLWPRHNLFFGGTHVATCSGGGAGDPRRGGVAVAV